MSSEVVLVTGANTGIGFQIVRGLCQSSKPYQIVVGGRTMSKVNDAIKAVEKEFPSTSSALSPIQVDIESDESIRNAFEEVQSKFGRLDALVNNAGTQVDAQLAEGTITERDMWNKTWDVNVSGTQVMTSTFAPLLIKASNPRLLFITSGTATLAGADSIAQPFNQSPPKGWPKTAPSVAAYRSAKTGMNMMMHEWHRILKQDGVKVWCISPGFLATGLGGYGAENLKKRGAGDPEVAGTFIRTVIEGDRDSDTGKVINSAGIQDW